MHKLRARSFKEKDSDEYYALVNNEGKFLLSAESVEDTFFVEIKYAEKFRWDYKKNKIPLSTYWKDNLGIKIKSIEQLAEVLNCKIVKVKEDITINTQVVFEDIH